MKNQKELPLKILSAFTGLCHSVESTGSINCLEVVVVVALLFYVHGKHLRLCRDGQLT